jgi:hypothetical protein
MNQDIFQITEEDSGTITSVKRWPTPGWALPSVGPAGASASHSLRHAPKTVDDTIAVYGRTVSLRHV